MLVVSGLQIAVATALMLVYSWQLTLVVWLCFLPLLIALGPAQRRVSAAYAAVRERVGALLGAVSESVVGAETIRAYGVSGRTQRRVDAAIRATRDAQVRAQTRVAVVFSSGVLVANLVLAAVVVVGTILGVDGRVTPGRLIAFLFLVQLFTGPVQMATEILNELQNALAGWRRVLGVIDTGVEIGDPEDGGEPSPRGAGEVALRSVEFAYAEGPTILHDVDLVVPARTKVAVVGATGSGKTTLARLVARLVDPRSGKVLLDGVDLRRLSLATLRSRVVLVPQEGFLFDGTVADNVAYGLRSDADPTTAAAEASRSFAGRGPGGWRPPMPQGRPSEVGPARGT